MTETPQLDEIAIRTAPEVFHARKWGISWSKEVIEELKIVAMTSARRRSRLCLHPSEDERHQEMLIVLQKDAIEIPQKRKNGFDTKVAVEGSALMRFFDESGHLLSRHLIDSTANPYLHTRGPNFHCLEVVSAWFVFLEICEGPFLPGTTQFWNKRVPA
jgi:cupin fold WbuC family metalloprotein